MGPAHAVPRVRLQALPLTVAIATAISASVTVSMGLLTIGTRSLMFLVTLQVRSTWTAQQLQHEQGRRARLQRQVPYQLAMQLLKAREWVQLPYKLLVCKEGQDNQQ